MAAVNSVTAGTTRLPLAGFPAPRAAVLMCSAAMGAEGSVTLQLREAEGPADAAALGFGGVLARLQEDSDADLLADMLGTLHAAGVDGAEGGGTASFGILEACPEQELAILGSPAEPEQASSTAEPPPATTTETSRLQAAKRPRPKAASPTRQGPQQCQMCSKVFGNASALAKHKLTHSDERKYVCTMCAKAFKRQDHLNGHMLTHRNKKPYECKAEGCGKSYCDARSLRRHRENHHGSSANETNTSSNNNNNSNNGNSNASNTTSVEATQAASPSAASSLSPSTASGDASSPHGASCIQYAASPSPGHAPRAPRSQSQSSHASSRSGAISAATSAGAGNEGLTRQQLELISQIMQQTKQQSQQMQQQQHQSSSRSNKPPRTWNMQTQLQQSQKKSNSVSSSANSNLSSVKATITNATNNHGEATKTSEQPEPKPVECNLCHRKFKNIPALNGHMRLHGGYFKKDSDNKKPDKKESALPPLQTASQSVRALIEEKIISRQQRVSTAPTTAAAVSPQQISAQQIISRSNAAASDFVVPAAPPRRSSEGEAQYSDSTAAVTTGKDATLIELLKRGTKLQVKRSLSDSGAPAQVQLSLQQTTDAAGNVTGGGEVFTLAYQNAGAGTTNTFYAAGDEVYVQDTAMLLQAVNSIQLLQQETDTEEQETLQDIASLEDYAAVSADLDVHSPEGYSQSTPCQTTGSLFAPVTRELRAVLDSPLPEGLAELGAYQDPPHSPKDLAAYQKEYLMYTGSPPSPLRYPCDSPGLGYPTPPASHETQASQHSLEHSLEQAQHSLEQSLEQAHLEHSLEHSLEQAQHSLEHSLEQARQTSSPLSAAFFTATMSSAEEVEEALETVLPGEMDVYDPQSPLQMSYLQTAQQMMMPNSDDPLLSSSPKDFAGRKKFEFGAGGSRGQRRGYNYVETDTKQEDSNTYICETVPRSRKRLRSVDMWPNEAESGASCSSRPAYCSRLKAGLNGPLQFTPTPMLDPDRAGSGLFKQLVGGGQGPELGEGPEPRINIGTAYQAALPECSTLREMDDPVREHLLWDPGITNCTDQEVERYLHFCSSTSAPWSSIGEETALQQLVRCSGDSRAARARLLRTGAGRAAGTAPVWSREEVDAFQAAIMRYRKDFGAISREVGTKTTAQCVAFYYIWKKVSGDYKSYYPAPRRTQQEECVTTAAAIVVDSRPHHCEMPDCSASFSSRAALHGHTRIHCSGAGGNSVSSSASNSSCTSTVSTTSLLQQQLTADQTADEYPCRICGKVFIKVKSRSAHMKSHRPVEASDSTRGGNKNAALVPRSPVPAPTLS